MKKIKVLLLLLTVACLLLCTACGGEDPIATDPTATGAPTDPDGGQILFTVTVVDDLGNPVPGGVIVNFMDGETLAAMQAVGDNGIAEKSLTSGSYSIQLAFTDPNAAYSYDENLHVTASQNQLTVSLSGYVSSRPLVIGDTEYTAYSIGVGITNLKVSTSDRTYFLFLPTQAGTYEFSAGGDAQIGYYGSTFFVQENNLGTPSEAGFTVSVAASMITSDGTAAMVLGVDSTQENVTVTIERIGDPEKTLEDYEWDVYRPTVELIDYVLPDNMTVADFDLTAATDAYKLVLNETDGFYHLNSADGPLVFCKLGVDSAYIDSIETILESSGISCYFYDEDGNFLKKESYSECLLEYVACMDSESGLYPLTEDLVYIIQHRGEFVGWWDPESPSYLFTDEEGNPVIGLNHEIAWLFLLCYGEVQEAPTEPAPTEPAPTEPEPTQPEATEPAPTEPTPTEPDVFEIGEESDETFEIYYYQISETMSCDATVKAGEYVYFDCYRLNDIVLTIHSEDAYIVYNDEVILPVNGVLQFRFVYSGSFYPCTVGIGNSGNQDTTFELCFSTVPGSIANPVTLELGTFTTATEDGNDQGFYYTFTATQSGVLCISFDSIDIDESCQITMTNQNTYVQNSAVDGTVTIEVSAGDTVQIIIGVSDSNYQYPAANITATASFN